jgi:hypothetical protein
MKKLFVAAALALAVALATQQKASAGGGGGSGPPWLWGYYSPLDSAPIYNAPIFRGVPVGGGGPVWLGGPVSPGPGVWAGPVSAGPGVWAGPLGVDPLLSLTPYYSPWATDLHYGVPLEPGIPTPGPFYPAPVVTGGR